MPSRVLPQSPIGSIDKSQPLLMKSGGIPNTAHAIEQKKPISQQKKEATRVDRR